jgi:hypothetical protein
MPRGKHGNTAVLLNLLVKLVLLLSHQRIVTSGVKKKPRGPEEPTAPLALKGETVSVGSIEHLERSDRGPSPSVRHRGELRVELRVESLLRTERAGTALKAAAEPGTRRGDGELHFVVSFDCELLQ